jgi:hypothetical protein
MGSANWSAAGEARAAAAAALAGQEHEGFCVQLSLHRTHAVSMLNGSALRFRVQKALQKSCMSEALRCSWHLSHYRAARSVAKATDELQYSLDRCWFHGRPVNAVLSALCCSAAADILRLEGLL